MRTLGPSRATKAAPHQPHQTRDNQTDHQRRGTPHTRAFGATVTPTGKESEGERKEGKFLKNRVRSDVKVRE